MNIAEFEVGTKLQYWNGTKFITTVVAGIQLNPINNIVEYKLFYREGSKGKRNRMYVVANPDKIKESIHFKK